MKCFCLDCKKETNHTVLFEKSIDWESDCGDISGSVSHRLVQCNGCEHITYMREDYCSEDWNWDTKSYDSRRELFPHISLETMPLEKSELLPQQIREIYFETLSAIDQELHILATIGLRACIEAIALDKGVIGKNLEKKIDQFVVSSTITASQADFLHQIRGIGNQAAHEIKPSSTGTIRKGLEVVEIILTVLYVLPTLGMTSP